MFRIDLNNININVRLGKHYEVDTDAPFPVSINISAFCRYNENINTIYDVIDYVLIEEAVLSFCENGFFDVIEVLAQDLCKHLLEKFGDILEVRVRVCKLGVMRSASEVCVEKKLCRKGSYVILALGSNIGDRLKNILSAKERLMQILGRCKFSNIYESKADIPEDAPIEWNSNFLNCAIAGYSNLSAVNLLQRVLEIEAEIGRVRSEKYAPRVIDIDIIHFDGKVVVANDLIIPHPMLHKRDFVLVPCSEVAPDIFSFHGRHSMEMIYDKTIWNH